MKAEVARILAEAIDALPELREAVGSLSMESTLERTRDASHGDFASNLAMRLAKPARRSPRDLAAAIVEKLPDTDQLDKVDIAGPGFINFHLSAAAFNAELVRVLDQGEEYGRRAPRAEPRILLEFVSANPTGPLHVGQALGYPVHREYYVNDAGRQMDILGLSVWLRWLEPQGTKIAFPSGGYRGEYIRDIAAGIDTHGIPCVDADTLLDGVPADEPAGDKEAHVEALIANAKKLVGEDGCGSR